jgi:hypothetical protein
MDHVGDWALERGSAVVWAGDKLRARCPTCASQGKHPDLQGSPEKVRARLQELREDPTRGTATYQLGG